MTHDADRNRRLTVALLAGAVVVPAALGLLVGLLLGVVVVVGLLGLLVGGGVALAAWFLALPAVLRGVHAGPATTGPAAVGVQRLENLVDGLCAATGATRPALHLVEDDAPNALAAGVRRSGAALVVTTGLLDTLGRVELEGVVGHLLARIRRDDVVPATLASFLLGPLAARVVPADAAAEADAAAVATTRYPPGLAAALTKLRDDPRTVAHAPRASLALWVVPVTARTSDPHLDHRIAVLREL